MSFHQRVSQEAQRIVRIISRNPASWKEILAGEIALSPQDIRADVLDAVMDALPSYDWWSAW